MAILLTQPDDPVRRDPPPRTSRDRAPDVRHLDAIIAASGGIARPGPTVAAALAALVREQGPRERRARVLICGSLYLAGEVLKADGTLPE